MSEINFFNVDCIEFMKSKPDNYYDLAIVDPPYGIGASNFKGFNSVKGKDGSIGKTKRQPHIPKNWDNQTPNDIYFQELFRVSKNQIIWGGNYFPLPPTRGIICWDKKQSFDNFSAWEMGWTSFDYPAAIFRYDNKGFMNKDGSAIHPTQKPIDLYRWILQKYAKPNDKIFDSHGGSMSSAIACDMEGFDLDICELDKDYFDAAIKRFNEHKRQLTIF